ncbi:hypothetical protein [Rhizobium sp. SSA_523]|uniref:hypothetical protein n=1 Tax=Rhizobium sp. SSA_523 TaxID=2952477 RepID=UPI002090E564|nr:hypothetical protein [Rhizobium sp. SSA_523]MCO5731663.1 hypothetical protein [Rhizobium sp. SSA_523]WKC22959.1 hypothetical protein QTJ18_19220 [Rhizobium sp. SSA_523]
MIKDPHNDPIASPEDGPAERQKKRKVGRTAITFIIIYALGAFSLYLFIVFFGSVASTQ